MATGGRGASNHADSFTVVFPSVLLIFSYRLRTRCRILRKRLRRAGVPRNGRRWQQLQVISADDRCRCSVESLGHGEILCGDAACVCDGQTPPTRRQVRDEWGTPGLLDILRRSWLGHPPYRLHSSRRRPITSHRRNEDREQKSAAQKPESRTSTHVQLISFDNRHGALHRGIVPMDDTKDDPYQQPE